MERGGVMKKYRMMVTKYGFCTVEASSESEAMEITRGLSDHAFDWSDFDEEQVVEEDFES